MGWRHPQSIWEVDKTRFPQGLTNIADAVESASGKLGLWMSPSEVYKPVIDYGWAESNGYVVVGSRSGSSEVSEGISLADPKYREAAKEQLQRLIQENQLGHIKYDGFIARETRATIIFCRERIPWSLWRNAHSN